MDTFHKKFDELVREIAESVREPLLESSGTCSREEIIGQILMNLLATDEACNGLFTADQKATLVRIADHMGPDWAQALYHAAVFITRVA